MAPFHSLAHSLLAQSPLLAAALVSSIWQGLLLTIAVGVALRFASRISPSARAALWTSVLVLLLALPVLTLTFHREAVSPESTGMHVAPGWSRGLLAIWLTISAFRAGQLVCNAVRLWRLAGRATPVAVNESIASALSGTRRAVLCVSSEVNRPSVAGFFCPRILLPAGLLEALSPAELKHVVLHEMEHLRRRDDWLNLFQQISLLLLPLQPALLWVDRQLCRERELACDDGVLASTHAPKAYAGCLVKLAEDSLVRKGLTLALSALGTRARESEIVGRVRRILSGPERVGTGWRAGLAISSVGLMAALGTGVLLRSPEWVHFDGAAPQLQALTVTAPGSDSLPAMPVVSRSEAPAGAPVLTRAMMRDSVTLRPALVKAVMSGARPVSALPFRKRPASRRALTTPQPEVRAVQIKASGKVQAAASSPWRQTAWQARSGGAAFDATGRLVVTELQISQPVYAAVAVPDGWLILQL